MTKEIWKYHKIILFEDRRSLTKLLEMMNGQTSVGETWRLDEVDMLNPLHDAYEGRVLSKAEIPPFISQFESIDFLDIAVISAGGALKMRTYCFDCNWVHIYTNDLPSMDYYVSFFIDNALANPVLEETDAIYEAV